MRPGRALIRVGTAAMVAALSFGTLPATADDHRPPDIVLRTGGEKQDGHPLYYTWKRSDGEFCVIEHADGFYEWPRRLLYDAGAKARIRFKKDERPQDVFIRDYRDVGRNGVPRGRPRHVDYRLRRREVGERVFWEAVFRRQQLGHHYLEVQAQWRDVDGCGLQEILVTFHLKAR